MEKSPLRYPGGKSRAVEFLSNFIPEFSEMREVFFGGGSLSFYYVQKFGDRKYLASDLNFELYCFWSQLKDNSKELIEGVQCLYDQYKDAGDANDENGRKLFDLLVSRRNENITELERGIDFFVLNRITFSGIVDSGGYSPGSWDGRFTPSSIKRLGKMVPLLQKIDFVCDEYDYLVNKDGKDVFLFLDPPYYSATKSRLYGKNGILHTEFDHEALFKKIKDSPHKWLITYDNCEYIKNLYSQPNLFQREWKHQYAMTNGSIKGNEILISNYDINEVEKNNLNKNKQQILFA